MHSRDTEIKHNWFTSKFSKDSQSTAPPYALVQTDVIFCITVARE